MEIGLYFLALSGSSFLYIGVIIAFLSLVEKKLYLIISFVGNVRFGYISLHPSFRAQRLEDQKIRVFYLRLKLLFLFYTQFHLQTGNKTFVCIFFGPCVFDG